MFTSRVLTSRAFFIVLVIITIVGIGWLYAEARLQPLLGKREK